MNDWREDLRSRGFNIADEPRALPSVPPRRRGELARWTVAWKRETTAVSGVIRETVCLPEGLEWSGSRSGVHNDRRFMSRDVSKPDEVNGNTIFKGYGHHYMHPYFFKWIDQATEPESA